MVTLVLAALLASCAVLVWPDPRRAARHGMATRRRPAPARRRLSGRKRAAAVVDALAVLDAMGPALRAGLTPSTALAHLAHSGVGSGGLVHDLAAAALQPAVGADPRSRASPVGDVWRRVARTTGAEELELVAAAWTLTDTAGVALADAVELAARLLRETRTRQARLDALLAGPRATMLLLTVLPVAGPVVGLLFGIDPPTLYAGSPLATAALCCGLALMLLGRLWCRALLRRATSAIATPAVPAGWPAR